MVGTITGALSGLAEPISMTWTQMAQYLEIPLLEQYTLPALATKYGYTYSKEIGCFIKTVVTSANPASSAIGTASEVFESYVGAGNGVTQLGSGVAQSAVGNVTLAIKNGVTSAAGVLATPIPAAFSALAPVAGVAAGVGLYNLNPDFWEEMSRSLMPWLWKRIDGIGASSYVKSVADSDGNVYFPKAAIQRLRSMLEDYRSRWNVTGTFNFSHGSIGAKVPLNGSDFEGFHVGHLCRWANPDLGDPLISGMTFNKTSGQGTYTFYSYDARELNVVPPYDAINYVFLDSQDGHIIKSSLGYLNDDIELRLRDTSYYDYEPGKNLIHEIMVPTGYTLVITPYLVVIDGYTYIGWHIENGENPWPPNKYWQPGYYIWELPLPIEIETGYQTHDLTVELPQIAPQEITLPSIQVITGIDENGDPDTEEYVPVPIPNIDPSPYIMPNPNEFPDDYPYPITAPALPNPTQIPQAIPTLTPELDPSENPNPETEQDVTIDIEISTPTPTPPPDEGDTPEFPLPWPLPIYGNSEGLMRVYNPTASEMRTFGNWMWTTWSGNVSDTLQKLFLNAPLDGVIGLHELYATPITSGRANIHCGFLDSGVESKLVSSRYSEINCGSLLVPEFYGNYLDYAPYTRISAYLPFVGIVNLEADDIVGHSVNITYRVDSYTGCVAALVTVAKNDYDALLYQFEGNAAVTIPLSSASQTALLTSALSVGASAIGGAITGGIAGAVGGAFAGGLRSMGGAKASVSHSGAFGGTFGAMGVKKPYLIIRRPVKKDVAYRDISGFPAYKRVYLNACSGFVRVKECEFNSPTATAEERNMILSALKDGVYV